MTVDRHIRKDLGWEKVVKASPTWDAPCQCHVGAAKPLQAHGPNPSVVGQGVSWPWENLGLHGAPQTPCLKGTGVIPLDSVPWASKRAFPFPYGGQFQRAAHLLCPTKHSASFFQASQKRKAFLLCTGCVEDWLGYKTASFTCGVSS